MATHTTTIRSPNSSEQVFAYVANFTNAADWHPAVSECRQLTAGSPTRVGARFHVVENRPGWKTDRVYEVIDVIDGRSVVLQDDAAVAAGMVSIAIAPKKRGGCVVRYRTDVRLRGVRVIADPVVRLLLRRTGGDVNHELGRLLAM